MKRKIYMSVPLSLDWGRVQLFKRRFSEDKFNVTLWDRENYFPQYFKEADSVVFLLPYFSWTSPVSDLPVGVRKELREAIEAKKKLYLGYVSDGNFNIYNAEVTDGKFSGISGTANAIFNEGKVHVDLFIPVAPNRILLLME